MKISETTNLSQFNIPIPVCEVGYDGKIISANKAITKVFAYDGIESSDFFALTGVKIADALDNDNIIIERNQRDFKIVASQNEDGYVVIFEDVTGYEQLKNDYINEKTCICKINIDNYDEFASNVEPSVCISVSAEVDKLVRRWAEAMDASIERIKETSYIIHFPMSFVRQIEESKFSLLDEVRSIETTADFPLSLSIGLGIGGKTYRETAGYADAALDLALGRGGDQAVVKKKSKISYYGGKTQAVEKSNKGKSRIVGHALKKLIEQSERVFIMGHKNADMDAFGAALGIYRLCLNLNTNAHIVINVINDSLQEICKQVKESLNYNMITTDKAKQMMEKNHLLIVVDTHRPSYLEDSTLLELTERIVVIDHHRKVVESIETPTLAYIETYASSTSELVAEILQYTGNKKMLVKLEAEALLAGITVDTNRFAVKTGVRTFEAAAWLRRSGADTTEVKRFFQNDIEDFKLRAQAIVDAKVFDNGIAISVCEGKNQEAQVINSQVADELLNIKGVKVSFVAGMDQNGTTCVSARSLGDVNVQMIIEKIGGGGHLTTAGAQVSEEPHLVIDRVVEIAKKYMEE